MNEFDFIKSLRDQSRAQRHSSRILTGIGDDAAILSQFPGSDLLITTDLLIEEIDFHRSATPPQLLGHKALAVSLSDIAAMGGRPLWSMVSLGLPNDLWQSGFKDKFFAGYFAHANQFGVTLIGGDLSESRAGVVIDSIVLGQVTSGSAVRRSGAQPGDHIFVTGTLGAAAAGLKLIEIGARLGSSVLNSLPGHVTRSGTSANENLVDQPESRDSNSNSEPDHDSSETKSIETLLLRQLRPSPRVGWGMVIGAEHLATAMIDISDGLSSDLDHLCKESNVGALIRSDNIPTDSDVTFLCGRRALDPLSLALHGGEDFELLFTSRAEAVARLPKRVDGIAISHIGEITDQPGKIQVIEKNHIWDLRPEGFEHFKKQ